MSITADNLPDDLAALKRIIALFDGHVVPFDIDGIPSGDTTEGHRFLGSGKPFTVKDFADYRAKLEREFVLLDVADRKLRRLLFMIFGRRRMRAGRGCGSRRRG